MKQRSEQGLSKNVVRDLGRDNRRGEVLAVHSLAIQRGCPWGTLQDLFTCDLAGPVSVAIRKENPRKVIAVRSFSRDEADKWLQVLRKTKHPNIISVREIFKDHVTIYFIVDDLPLTLEHVVACDPSLSANMEALGCRISAVNSSHPPRAGRLIDWARTVFAAPHALGHQVS